MKTSTAHQLLLIGALFAAPSFAAKTFHADSSIALTGGLNAESNSLGSLRFERGRFVGGVRNKSLAVALKEIGNTAGIGLRISGSLPAETVTKRLSNLSLIDAIRQVLSGQSYILYPDAAGFRIVLLGDQQSANHEQSANCVSNPAIDQMAQGCETQGKAENPPPTSLDDFRLIPEAQAQLGDANTDSRLAAEISKARLKRAQDVLKSQYRHLYQEALIDIIGINDPEASRALIDAVNAPPNESSRARMAELLVTHATNLGFSDHEVIAVLQQLAEDQDKGVKDIARQALAEIPQ